MWVKTKQLTAVTLEIFKTAGKQYGLDRVNRMASAVAYRTMFALAPLFLVAIFVLGLFVGDVDARQELLDVINRVAGPTVIDALENFLRSVGEGGGTAGLVGFGLLLWTGSSLFLELQNDLNDIFEVPSEQTTGIIETIRKRGIGFLWALGLGLILVAIWLLNSLWQLVDDFLPSSFDPVHRAVSVLTPAISVLLLPFVFGLIFQTLTQVKVRWRAVWWGSFFTAVAFLLASYATSLYFRLAGDSPAGIAGALFVILLLAYVLSAVFLFGAEVTKVYDRYLETGKIAPDPPPGPGAIVAAPEPAMPVSAVLGFLGGLLVGWRRRR